MRGIHSKLHISLQQLLIHSIVIARGNDNLEIIVHLPLTQTNSHYSDAFKQSPSDGLECNT